MQASHVTWKSCDIPKFGDDDLATAELDETFANTQMIGGQSQLTSSSKT